MVTPTPENNITIDDITDEFTASLGVGWSETMVFTAIDNLIAGGMSVAELFDTREFGTTLLTRKGAQRLRDQVLEDTG